MLSAALRQIHFYTSYAKFSTTLFHQSYNDVRIGKIMNKLLKNSKSKKRKFYALPAGGTPQYMEYISSHKTSKKGDKRLNVLNKVFMKNITDLIATGEICPKIAERGIQISKVKVTPTYHQINVHWLANGTDDDIETESLLSEFAPKLRHGLSQLQIMGAVPKVEFIKDSSYLKYTVVENILKNADYGDDFEPTPLASDWKSDDEHEPPLPLEVKDESKIEESVTEDRDDPLPVMRMDTFGLKHDAIMTRINQAVQRAKGAHRRDRSIFPLEQPGELSETDSVLGVKERKKLLREFLLKKKLDWKKSINKEKKYRPDGVINQEDLENKLVREFLQCDEENNLEEFDVNSDYLEDDYSRN